MPRLQPLTHFLALTGDEAKMLTYLLETGAMSEMPQRWTGHATRLLNRIGQPESVLRVLDVSTAHLTVQERLDLEHDGLPGQCYTGDFGGIVSTCCYAPGVQDDFPDGASDTLVAIMREAIRRGCSYVGFDADARPLAGFPILETED